MRFRELDELDILKSCRTLYRQIHIIDANAITLDRFVFKVIGIGVGDSIGRIVVATPVLHDVMIAEDFLQWGSCILSVMGR